MNKITEFTFEVPECFLEAKKVFDESSGEPFLRNQKACKALVLLMHKEDAEREARWHWLSDNKNAIWYVALETRDIGYMWANVLAFIDTDGHLLYEEVFDSGGRRTAKKLKNKMKRYGLPLESLSINILH